MVMSSSFIPSAQVIADGQPRFQIPAMPEHPAWAGAAMEEEAGGVSAEVRAFLDAQLGGGDVVIDLAPGFGFVALGATTAPGGMPTVFVSGLEEDRLQALQDVAVDVGGWLDELPVAEQSQLASLAEARLEPEGRVFVHVDAKDVTQVSAWLQPLLDTQRVLAICIGDAANSTEWAAAAATLAEMQFTPCGVVEQDGELIIVPITDAPDAAVIALPTSLVDGAED